MASSSPSVLLSQHLLFLLSIRSLSLLTLASSLLLLSGLVFKLLLFSSFLLLLLGSLLVTGTFIPGMSSSSTSASVFAA